MYTAIAVLTSMIPAVFLWRHEGAITTFAVVVVITSIWWGGKQYVKMFTKYETVINSLLEHGHIIPSSDDQRESTAHKTALTIPEAKSLIGTEVRV